MTTASHTQLSKLTLKSFKTVRWMSEETICFTATVLLDGKVIGTASNEGHGGCTFVRFEGAKRFENEALAEAFAKSINPCDIKGWEFRAENGFKFDDLVDILVEAEDKKQHNKKTLNKVKKACVENVIFTKAGEDPKAGFRLLKCGSANVTRGIAAMVGKYGSTITIYNGMSDEALAFHFCV
jgi:hypothetical protein